jgi:hypothetical protein
VLKTCFVWKVYYTWELWVCFDYWNRIFLSVPRECIRFVIHLVPRAVIHILRMRSVDLCVCGHVGEKLQYSFRTYWDHVFRFHLVWSLRRRLVSLKQRNFCVSETLINFKQHTYCRTGNNYLNTVSICFVNFCVPFDSLSKMGFGEFRFCRMNTKWNRILLRDFVRSVMNDRTVSQIICC